MTDIMNTFDEDKNESIPESSTLEDDSISESSTLEDDTYLNYLLSNYSMDVDYLDRVRESLKKPKVRETYTVQIGDWTIEVKPYTIHRIRRILKKYFGNSEKGGYGLERIYEYKYGRYPGQEVHYDIIDNETKKVVIPYATLRTIRVILSGIAGTGFPLEDMYDQIFEFRLMSWQEHGFPLFPAEKDLFKY